MLMSEYVQVDTAAAAAVEPVVPATAVGRVRRTLSSFLRVVSCIGAGVGGSD